MRGQSYVWERAYESEKVQIDITGNTVIKNMYRYNSSGNKKAEGD